MKRSRVQPALIVHGGAGGRAAESELPRRRSALLRAVETGGEILREGGDALTAVVEAVRLLEDDPLFNAGFGSCLTKLGTVEMDAGVMTASITTPSKPMGRKASAGGVVMVSRVRNPILLARVVMERTPHLLVGGEGAERLAREAGLPICRATSMISQRARDRWLALNKMNSKQPTIGKHGTVGAAALDGRGNVAAATSTGGVVGKLPGRIGDSAIPGAGVYAGRQGAASATGLGEAILAVGLSRVAVDELKRRAPQAAAKSTIRHLFESTGGEAGVILVDAAGQFGAAHNAAAMEVATFDTIGGSHHLFAPSYQG